MTQELVERGTELVLGECEPHLVNLWARLGLRPFGLCEHPTNGTLVRLALVCGDLDHTRSIDSPLAPSPCARPTWRRSPPSARLCVGRADLPRWMAMAQRQEWFWAKVEDSLPLDRLAAQLGGLSGLSTALRILAMHHKAAPRKCAGGGSRYSPRGYAGGLTGPPLAVGSSNPIATRS
jgi:hypothetical protein